MSLPLNKALNSNYSCKSLWIKVSTKMKDAFQVQGFTLHFIHGLFHNKKQDICTLMCTILMCTTITVVSGWFQRERFPYTYYQCLFLPFTTNQAQDKQTINEPPLSSSPFLTYRIYQIMNRRIVISKMSSPCTPHPIISTLFFPSPR